MMLIEYCIIYDAISYYTQCPKKNALSESSLRSYNPSKPTSLACRLQAASGDLSDVSACRMTILQVHFFWETLYYIMI